ncbi:MAG: hypothetical protein GYA33_04915 [Thermogutta sp.]|nr:hypothetical protein [Thermogutta sp.]
MSQATSSPGKANIPPEEELAALIAAACKQPGIQEVMQLYQQWKPYEAIARIHRHNRAIPRVSVASDSSDRTFPCE